MSLCKILVDDYMHGFGSIDPVLKEPGYGATDLDHAIRYADALHDDGFRTEPFYGFHLRKFSAWCRGKLTRLGGLYETQDWTVVSTSTRRQGYGRGVR